MDTDELVRILLEKGIITKSDIVAVRTTIGERLKLKNILTVEECSEVQKAVEVFVVPTKRIPAEGMWAGQGNTHLNRAKTVFDINSTYSEGMLRDLLMLLRYAKYGNEVVLTKLKKAESFFLPF